MNCEIIRLATRDRHDEDLCKSSKYTLVINTLI